MGGAVNATLRQIGAALGIAIGVAILGDAGSPDAFDRAFTFVTGTAVAAGLLMWVLYRPPVSPMAEPATDGSLAPIL
jgi:hypothetical protein